MKKQILLIVPLLILGYVAYGCSCAFENVDVHKIMRHDLVFAGKIIKKEEINNSARERKIPSKFSEARSALKYTFAVKKLIHGNLTQKQVVVYSTTSGAACGVNYEVGDEYYLFAYEYQSEFHTGLCSQNIKKQKATKPYKKLMRAYRKSKRLKEWKDVKGKVTASGKVVHKKAEGTWVFYHKDKTTKAEGDFVNGEKHGDWKYYYSEEASQKLWSRIDELQKSKIKNKKNIMYRIEFYNHGEKSGEEYLFTE